MGSIDKFRKQTREEADFRAKKPPPPVFLGDFLVHNLIKPHQKFNIEEDRLAEALSDLPENIRDLAKGWVMIYLAWLFKVYAFKRYGPEFTNKLLLAVREKIQKIAVGEEAGLWLTLQYWFANLDRVSCSAVTSDNNPEAPFEVLIALCFMVFDADSPYYKNQSAETNMVEFDVGFILGSAAREAKQTIQVIIDTGHPVEEVCG